MQQAIHRGLAGHVLTGIGQTGHDLTEWQVFELTAIENPHDSIAFGWAKFVGRRSLGAQRAHSAVSSERAGVRPALHGSAAQTDLRTGVA